jgi:hypothetical protein
MQGLTVGRPAHAVSAARAAATPTGSLRASPLDSGSSNARGTTHAADLRTADGTSRAQVAAAAGSGTRPFGLLLETADAPGHPRSEGGGNGARGRARPPPTKPAAARWELCPAPAVESAEQLGGVIQELACRGERGQHSLAPARMVRMWQAAPSARCL